MNAVPDSAYYKHCTEKNGGHDEAQNEKHFHSTVVVGFEVEKWICSCSSLNLQVDPFQTKIV